MILANADGNVQLYYDNALKLATTATGIDVTGTVTADGLTVETSTDPASITLRHTGNTSGLIIKNFSGGEAQLVNVDNGPMVFKTNNAERMRIDASGDVGIGTSSPVGRLHSLVTTAGDASLSLQLSGSSRFEFQQGIVGVTGDALRIIDTTLSRDYLMLRDGNVGIGTSSPSAPLHVFKSGGSTTSINVALTLDYESPTASLAGSGTAILFKGKSGGGNLAQYDQAMISTNNIGSDNSHGLSFFYKPNAATALTEGLTLDEEGNVGIGTSSPNFTLQLDSQRADATFDANNLDTWADFKIQGQTASGNARGIYFDFDSDTGNDRGAGIVGISGDATGGVGSLGFITTAGNNSAERMRITSAGNVGIGNSTPLAKLQIDNTAASHSLLNLHQLNTSYNTDLNLFNQASTTSSTIISKRTDGGLWLYQSGADYIAAYTNSSERLRIDSSGNVGIGTSSPAAKLDVNGVVFVSPDTAGKNTFHFTTNAANDASLFLKSDTTNKVNIQANGTSYFNGGNVGIGTSSPVASLDVVAGADDRLLVTNSSGDTFLSSVNAANTAYNGLALNGSEVKLFTNASERMRIDSSGNLLVGATVNTTNSKLIIGGATRWAVGTQSGGNLFYIVRDSDNVGQYMVNGATSWTATSDERLKDIIEPITDAANKVSTLRAVIGKFKKDAEGTRRSFLIAQDVQAVLPEAVTVQEDEAETLGIQYTEVIPLLVAAIKEQQDMITALTTRIEALEGVN
jgi:hypothetical protein